MSTWKSSQGSICLLLKSQIIFSVGTIFKRDKKPIRDKKKYLSLFEKVKDEKIIGEASPSYLSDPEAPKLIHQVVPNAHILISLRDPVERAYSSYLMNVRRGRTKNPFKQEIQTRLKNNVLQLEDKVLSRSGYYRFVKKYLEIFGHNQVKIIIFEEFIKNPKRTVEDILKFLGCIEPLKEFKVEIHNPYTIARGQISGYFFQKSAVRKLAQKIIPSNQRKFIKDNIILKKQSKPMMDEEIKKTLINFYRDDVKNLKKLLGRDLPWKNF